MLSYLNMETRRSYRPPPAAEVSPSANLPSAAVVRRGRARDQQDLFAGVDDTNNLRGVVVENEGGPNRTGERSENSTSHQTLSDLLRREITDLAKRIDQVRENSEHLASKAQTQAVQASQQELRAIENRILGLLKEAHRVLVFGGRLSIMHWRSDIPTPRGPSLDIRPTPEQCLAWMERVGFKDIDVSLRDCCPFHFALVASRQDSARSAPRPHQQRAQNSCETA